MKSIDYALIALLIATAAAITSFPPLPARGERVGVRGAWIAAIVIFIVMFFVHDHPYVVMDPFHEGEHLTPAFLFRAGERPYTDVFVLHGLAYDGGLDALVLGNPPSPLRTRRLETILDAASRSIHAGSVRGRSMQSRHRRGGGRSSRSWRATTCRRFSAARCWPRHSALAMSAASRAPFSRS